jgi:diaminopimelate decarboxylase
MFNDEAHLNQLAKHPAQYDRGGRLNLAGNSLKSLIPKLGTPLYVYSKDRILQNLESLRGAFSRPVEIHYALKANSNPSILRLLKGEGAGLDVVSGGEIRRALECGFKGADIVFSGVGKTADEITFALKSKIDIFNVESSQELERIGSLAKKMKSRARVSFRLNPDVDPKTHPYITTGFKRNKFGMDKSFLPELLRILSKYPRALSLVGLDFHIGSQLTDLKPIVEATRKTTKIYQHLRGLGYPLEHFDIGGGIGISYTGEKTIDLKSYGRMAEELLCPLGCKILCEPGRSIVGDAGVLLTRVEYIKKTPFKTFIIVDTGMHHLLRPSLYGAEHRIVPLVKTSSKKIKADIVGPICESSDWLGRDRQMPEPAQGDILAILDAGAYGYVMANDYNLRDWPKEVLI